MKRIINVSYFSSIRLKNCYINDINKKVTNGFIRNGYDVINYSDRDICRFLSPIGSRNSWALKRLQKHFINFCRKYKPDAIIMCHAETIKPETLKTIRDILPNLKVMQYNLDPLNPMLSSSAKNVRNISSKLDVVDATLVTTGNQELLKQFYRPGKYVGFLPNIVDKHLEKGSVYDIKQPKYDVSFAGNDGIRDFCGENVEYIKIIEKIKQTLPNATLKIFGLNKKNKIEGPEYQELFENTAIGLNLSRSNRDYLYSSDRMAHIMGNGALCILDKATGFNDIFSDDEIVFYENPEEFYEKLKFYVANPEERMKIAKKGHDKYVELFNEIIVTKYMADVLFGTLNKDDYLWTKLVDITEE